MEELFLKLLNMSITAGWLVLAIVVLRLLMKKAPKWISCTLWVLVGLRLIFPFSVESVLSLIPTKETIPPAILYSQTPTINTGIPILNNALNPVISESLAPNPGDSVNPIQVWLLIGTAVWIAGMVGMAAWSTISYLRIRHQTKEAIAVERNIYLCDRIPSPFILGLFRPRIFLPSNMDEQDKPYVIAHEMAHLKRKDHWWKPLAFLLLSIYWFHPLLWISYILLCRDIELACDEKVISQLGAEKKKPYSQALIHCSVSEKHITACPLAFGEVGVKQRILSVLYYKKPTLWILIAALIILTVAAVMLLTDPVIPEAPSDSGSLQMQIIFSQPSFPAFEEGCFYACDAEGTFYRVYYESTEELYEGCRIQVEYKNRTLLTYPNGFPSGPAPQFELHTTAVKALDTVILRGEYHLSTAFNPVSMSSEDVQTFLRILRSPGKGSWTEDSVNQKMCDFVFIVNGKQLHYQSDVGFLNDYEANTCLYLCYADNTLVTNFVSRYLFNASIPTDFPINGLYTTFSRFDSAFGEWLILSQDHTCIYGVETSGVYPVRYNGTYTIQGNQLILSIDKPGVSRYVLTKVGTTFVYEPTESDRLQGERDLTFYCSPEIQDSYMYPNPITMYLTDTSEEIPLSYRQSNVIIQIARSTQWTNNVHDCKWICEFRANGIHIALCDCGNVRNVSTEQVRRLSEEQQIKIKLLLAPYRNLEQ